MDASTSSSSSLKRWNYDVYLSFRGEYTRPNITDFTNHLCDALKHAKVNFFVGEDNLSGLEYLRNDLNQAIQGSKVAVIVFSENYAESRFCLDDLAKIMECRRTLGQMVIPIFCEVQPSEVRTQTGTFATAFLDHDWPFYDAEEKLHLWRDALTEAANLSGFYVRNTNWDEGQKYIGEIVTEIIRVLYRIPCLATNPVGIDSRVQEISNYLDVGGLNDVRIIGIWGMGGVGKTTVAKAIFNKYQNLFDGKSFLASVREEKLVKSQYTLLSDVLRSGNIKVSRIDEGTEDIKIRLGNQMVLVIVDEVDSVKQLEALAIKRDSFGPGSRIIITTRDQHLLKILKANRICHLPAMNKEEALELLSWHAFRKNYPNKEYLHVSREVVDYCGGLPLALEVLGSYLSGKSSSEWKSELEKLKCHPRGEILNRLKISFDELADDDLKAIFLDISCFFTGMSKDHVMKILDGCDLYPEIGISVLQERCLVTTNDDFTLVMHDLLRDMGREIVRLESRDPGKRSRLWHHDDVLDVLTNKSGTEAIQGLTLDLQESDETIFSTEAFRNMHSLRLLKLNYVKLTGSYNNLFNDLRWLCWHGFPLEVIPEDFDHPNIVVIDLSYSKLTRVWEDSDLLLEKLKFLNLSHSRYLRQSPDFSKLPNLEQLVLQDCKSLLNIDRSIGQLEKLVSVDLKDCLLRDLPESFYKLTSIETLDLTGCSNFENLEDLAGNVLLEKLKFLYLGYCNRLIRLPDFSKIPNLERLILEDCNSLSEIHSVVRLKKLKYLSLANCNLADHAIPIDLGALFSLEVLDARGNGFKCLPILSRLNKLQTLHLNNCTNLQKIPYLPTNLEILEADECIALEKMPNFSEMSRMRVLHLNHSPKITEIGGLHKSLKSMTRIHMEGCTNLTAEFRKKILQGWTSCGYGGIFLNGNYIPDWFKYVGDDEVSIVVPQGFGSNFNGLTLCCVYSSNKQPEDCPLVISVENTTMRTALLAHITYASVPTFCDYEDHYLWQGQLSNDVLRCRKGDQVNIFVGPAQPGDNSARVKKIAVDLVWDKFMKENMDDSHPGLYDLNPHQDCLSGDNDEARTSRAASDENLPSKILRSDSIGGGDDEVGASTDLSDENQTPKRGLFYFFSKLLPSCGKKTR
ncbi:unnamed protein product [Malus baccata var. baccata]